jgi:hypothetical protein
MLGIIFTTINRSKSGVHLGLDIGLGFKKSKKTIKKMREKAIKNGNKPPSQKGKKTWD